MKRFLKKTIFLFLMLNCSIMFSQNLVPNFSFEQYDTCPSSQDQIQFATGWSKYSDAFSTPDYYNACAPSGVFSVPYNATGYQSAHRNCNSYAGLVIWAGSNDREHIGIQLSQPLTIGQKYFISFYTVMSEALIVGNYYGMPSNNIGMRLSTVAYSASNPYPIDNFAHVYSSAVINDSINWILISGSILADSAYDYVILGNFFDNANTDTVHYTCGTCLNNFSYYYIDDICVSTDSLLCNGGIDILPCVVSVNEIVLDDDVNVFPNPTIDYITVSFPNYNEKTEILLYNVLGKIVFTSTITNSNSLNINLSSFSLGCYTLKIINKNNNHSIIKKIIKY